jgi:hypothetical protein
MFAIDRLGLPPKWKKHRKDVPMNPNRQMWQNLAMAAVRPYRYFGKRPDLPKRPHEPAALRTKNRPQKANPTYHSSDTSLDSIVSLLLDFAEEGE